MAIDLLTDYDLEKNGKKKCSIITEKCLEGYENFFLDLFSSATESEYCAGNFDQVEVYANKVMNEPKYHILDKLRVSSIMLDMLVATGRHKPALAFGMTVL